MNTSTRKNKLLSLLISLALIITLIPALPAYADEVDDELVSGNEAEAVIASGDFGPDTEAVWVLTEAGRLTISGSGAVPYYGAQWESASASVTSLEIGEGITSIEEDAFFEQEKLEEVTLPESLQSIGESAFEGCSALKEVLIPAAVKTIGKNAFARCTSIELFVYEDAFIEGEYLNTLEPITLYASPSHRARDIWNTGRYHSVRPYCTIEDGVVNLSHKVERVGTVPASDTEPGETGTLMCVTCEYLHEESKIAYPIAEMSLGSISDIYDGRKHSPEIYARDTQGQRISKDFYTLKYSPGRVAPGKYWVEINFSGPYSGSKRFYYKIKPKLNKTAKTIYYGDSLTLVCKGGEAQWTSSKTEIAKVSEDGTVKARNAEGKTTITATVNGQKATCKITVKKPKLLYKKKTIKKGKTFLLKFSEKGNGTVKWSSSNKKIATVSSKGKITAKKEGKCTITAKYNGYKLTCAVTVAPNPNVFVMNPSTVFRDDEFGNVILRFKKAEYTSDKDLKLTLLVQNNYILRAVKFKKLKMTAYDANGTVIARQTFDGRKIGLSGYTYKNMTFTFDEGTKGVHNLRNGVLVAVIYEVDWDYN